MNSDAVNLRVNLDGSPSNRVLIGSNEGISITYLPEVNLTSIPHSPYVIPVEGTLTSFNALISVVGQITGNAELNAVIYGAIDSNTYTPIEATRTIIPLTSQDVVGTIKHISLQNLNVGLPANSKLLLSLNLQNAHESFNNLISIVSSSALVNLNSAC